MRGERHSAQISRELFYIAVVFDVCWDRSGRMDRYVSLVPRKELCGWEADITIATAELIKLRAGVRSHVTLSRSFTRKPPLADTSVASHFVSF